MNAKAGKLSVGRRGALLNFSKQRVRQTVGIPGSGLSESSYIIKNKSDEEDKQREEKDERRSTRTARDSDEPDEAPDRGTSRLGAWPCMLLLGIIIIYLGAVVLNLIPYIS